MGGRQTHGVAIVGSYPPNYGGISTHVQRLHVALAPLGSVTVFDVHAGPDQADGPGLVRVAGPPLQTAWRVRRALARRDDRLHHFHVSAMAHFLWASPLILGRRGRTGEATRVLTIHGGAFGANVRALPLWGRWLFRWMLRRLDHFVCVSAEQRDVLLEWGVHPTAVSVIPAYLPPAHPDREHGLAPLAAARQAGRPVIVCVAQLLEHYGVVELLEALHGLRGPPRPLLVLVTYLDRSRAYAERCRTWLDGSDAIVVQDVPSSQVAAILADADVFVRPTWWDGDAVSLREAAFFGLRIVATDVAKRPVGAELCAAKSASSLREALRGVLEDPTRGRVDFDHGASLRALRAVYRRCGLAFGSEDDDLAEKRMG